jgi:hypothetical protein
LSEGVEIHLSAYLVEFLQNQLFAQVRPIFSWGNANLSVMEEENPDNLALIPVANSEPIQWVQVHDSFIIPSAPMDEVIDDGLIDNDQVVSRKRRRQTILPEPELITSIIDAPLRRSTRSKRYQGFRQNLNSDSSKRKSHVKPRRVPGKMSAKSAKGKEVAEDSSAVNDPTMQPTPVVFLQQLGVAVCGIPNTELSEKQLLVPRGDVAPAASEETTSP